MKSFAIVLFLGNLAVAAPLPKKEPIVVTTASGLKYVEVKAGTGPTAASGQTVEVHYTLWLKSDQKKVDSSVDRNNPFEFKLGAGMVIKGFDEGVIGMKVGGKRTLTLPAALGYGDRGAGDQIPPNADLVCEIELLKIK